MSLRKVLFWMHLTAGICASIVILIMCITGALLTYERQINSWADHRELPFRVQPNSQRLSIEALLTKATSATLPGGARPNSITVHSSPNEPAELGVGRGSIYIDTYSGNLLGAGTQTTRKFFRSVEDLHRWLAMSDSNRAAGKSITGAANLIFFFIVWSGLYLWMPRQMQWRHFRPALLIRSGLSGKARDWNWHNAIGIWAWAPLVLVVGSGVVMSYTWANNLLYTLSGSTIPLRQGAARATGEAAGGRRMHGRAAAQRFPLKS